MATLFSVVVNVLTKIGLCVLYCIFNAWLPWGPNISVTFIDSCKSHFIQVTATN